MNAGPALPDPFRWDGDHIAIGAAGGQALFMTTRGGSHPVLRMSVAEGHQVHEQRVRRVRSTSDLAAPLGDYDGHATYLRGVGCKVVTADCLPVALIAEDAVAMVHAGWRGLALGVLEEGVRAIRELGAGEAIVAAIGPGAGACCYEVGEEVMTALDQDGSAPARIDLKAIAARRLAAAGVENVHDAGICTICADPGLFCSFRRDGTPDRQWSFAWRS